MTPKELVDAEFRDRAGSDELFERHHAGAGDDADVDAPREGVVQCGQSGWGREVGGLDVDAVGGVGEKMEEEGV